MVYIAYMGFLPGAHLGKRELQVRKEHFMQHVVSQLQVRCSSHHFRYVLIATTCPF